MQSNYSFVPSKKVFLILFYFCFSSLFVFASELNQSLTVDFSHKRGFYDSPFNITLTSNPVGASVMYTLDGSHPLTSSTAIKENSPCSVRIDPTSTINRSGKTPGVIVRAVAIIGDISSSKVKTHTYLFVNEVIDQSSPGGDWPNPVKTTAWPGYYAAQSIGYAMDTRVTKATRYKNNMYQAMTDIPSFSIVTELDDMFGKEDGIYMNPLDYGSEKAVSLEMLDYNEDTEFQYDAGVRIRGRYSRLPRNPKHSFRIIFRNEYGDSKLDYKLFDEKETSKFDRIDFRCAQNSSWQAENGSENTVTFLKEIFSRDAQREMGMYNTTSKYCHLYLNGMYWGLYQIQERADNHFANTYLGDEVENYDIIKPQKDIANPKNDLMVGVSDGNMDAAGRLWNAMLNGFSSNEAYYKVQGMNSDGTINPAYERLLDVENLIDYLLIPFYMGSKDGPGVTWVSLWGNMVRPNNFIGIYNRVNPDGFKWIVHDFEKSMYDKNDNWPLVEKDSWFSTDINFFSPLNIHRECMKNPEYLQLFADRVYKHMENDGVLSASNVLELFKNRRDQIQYAVIGESARWGGWFSGNEIQTQAHWQANVNWLLSLYIPYRTNIVLNQFKGLGLYTSMNPPSIKVNEQILNVSDVTLSKNDNVTVSATGSDEIFFTLNGEDPRAIGGGVLSVAQTINNDSDITINNSSTLKIRSKSGEQWSPLREINFKFDNDLIDLKITEIAYHMEDVDSLDDQYEFIELKNTGNSVLDLTWCSFTKGIEFSFDNLLLAPNEFVVIAKDTTAFSLKYKMHATGQFKGNLNNAGEVVELSNAVGTTVLSCKYRDSHPWPIVADGLGKTLVAIDSQSTISNSDQAYWRASTNIGGSPFADDVISDFPVVIINEILSNPSEGNLEAIELYNSSADSVDISNWMLSDKKDFETAWMITPGTKIGGESYVVFYEGHFDADTVSFNEHEFGAYFSISSHGEGLYLASSNADSSLTGYITGVKFGEAEVDVSMGTFINSIGEFHCVALEDQTFGGENAYPVIGPLVVTEIMYNPPEGAYEYVKIENISDENIDLVSENTTGSSWEFEGLNFKAEDHFVINAGDSLYLIQKEVDSESFKNMYFLDDVAVLNIPGEIDNSGESITLFKPGEDFTKGEDLKSTHVLVEKISYKTVSPWPEISLRSSLYRKDKFAFANDPANWIEKTIDIKVGKLDFDAIAFKAFPNPTHGFLTLKVNENFVGSIVSVFNVQGREMTSFVIENPESSIDLSPFSNGMYILKLDTHWSSKTQLILKQ